MPMQKEKLKNFEVSMKELESILEKISNSETGLDESIDLYSKAAALLSECHSYLKDAEIKIEDIDKIIDEM